MSSMDEDDVADFGMTEEVGGRCPAARGAGSPSGGAPATVDGLAVQDLAKLDLNTIAVDSPEVMSRQATINIGTIGHVAHGKSTVVKALSGVKTQKYHREAVMNITIHLGYANAKVYQCGKCPRPSCFQTYPSSQPDVTPCPNCGEPMSLRRHLSFVDCPGHDVLMATMLNGAAIMDAALLLIAANEPFPQPQTLEHLAAAEMMGIRHVMVVQNKIDLVPRASAAAQYDVIKAYLRARTRYSGAPVVPLCAQLQLNLPYLIAFLAQVPLPPRDLACRSARLHVLRSFDVSRPGELFAPEPRDGVCGSTDSRDWVQAGANGTEDGVKEVADAAHAHSRASRTAAETLPGGVVGGTVQCGVLCCGDEIEFLPGLLSLMSRDGRQRPTRVGVLRGLTVSYLSAPPPGELYCVPLRTRVTGLKAERNALQYAVPGGLIAVGTSLDPALTRQSKLRGQVLRVVRSRRFAPDTPRAGTCPTATETTTPTTDGDPAGEGELHVYQELDIQFMLLKELLGLSTAYHRQQQQDERERRAWAAAGQPNSYRVHPPHTQLLYTRVRPLQLGESIVLCVGTMSTAATVMRVKQGVGRAQVLLASPVCGEIGSRVVLARYIDQKVRLIGWGIVRRGVPLPILS